MPFWAGEIVFVATVWLVLAALTAIGAAHRGHRPAFCLASGVLFPVAWLIWYAIDELAPGRGRLTIGTCYRRRTRTGAS